MASTTAERRITVEESRIRYVTGPGILEIWPILRPHVADAIERDPGYSPEDVRDMIVKGDAVALLVLEDGDIVATLVVVPCTYPRRRTLCVVTVGGARFWDWAPEMQELLESMLPHYNATALEARCRPGMSKWLERLGWVEIHRVMEHRG